MALLLCRGDPGLPAAPAFARRSAGAIADSGDYPSDHSLFPPDLTPPTFLWRDSSADAKTWRIRIVFADGSPIQLISTGPLMRVAEEDDSYGGYVKPVLTSEQAASHTWTPDGALWSTIKARSTLRTATVQFTGISSDDAPVSRGQVVIQTSTDPVGAPILYRDVPLLPTMPQGEHGIIKPLPDSLLPYVKWRLRYPDDTGSKVVMSDLPTCANCHSASRDGKVLGLDVDGPSNNKALYSLMPLKPVSSMNKESIVQWSRFTEGAAQRFGFMSQVSPDGKYVVTSVRCRAPAICDSASASFRQFPGV